MKFRTEIEPLRGLAGSIDHSTPLLMLGSCFTDSVGSRLRRDGFAVTANPFGPLYNPASIAATLKRLADDRNFNESDIFFDGTLHHSFMSHTSLSRADADECLTAHREAFQTARQSLCDSKIMILTLGTARVFTLKSTGKVVANCHKLPASHFAERVMSPDECVKHLKESIAAVKAINPLMKTILTVSPIRHRGNRPQDNSIAKAALVIAVDSVCHSTPDCIYFPSYEIVLDDLRDYRFYDTDMRHPSAIAADYVYSLFADTFFSAGTKELARQHRAAALRSQHQPLTDRFSSKK